MFKKDRKKAHITILKTELVFISVALVLSAFVLGFFSGKSKGGAVFEIAPISYTEQATGRNLAAHPASSAGGEYENPMENKEAPGEAAEPSENTGANSPGTGENKGEPGMENSVSKPEIDGKININTADLTQLKSLPGIGDVLAGKIIDYREKIGGFKNIYEIMDVNGIGEKTFQKLEALIYVG